jgi:hypothetical protein
MSEGNRKSRNSFRSPLVAVPDSYIAKSIPYRRVVPATYEVAWAIRE